MVRFLEQFDVEIAERALLLDDRSEHLLVGVRLVLSELVELLIGLVLLIVLLRLVAERGVLVRARVLAEHDILILIRHLDCPLPPFYWRFSVLAFC